MPRAIEGTDCARMEPGRIAGYLAVGGFLAFCLTWWNRSLNPTLSGDLFYRYAYDHGALPYRDYYFAAPPGMFFQSVALESIFGHRLIALWAFGLALRSAAVLAAYLLIRRVVPPAVAAWAVLASAIASCGDVADSPYFYNHVAVSYVVIGAAFAGLAFSSSQRWPAISAAASGSFLAAGALIKHTAGFLCAAAVLIWVTSALWRLRGRRRAVEFALAALGGFVGPLALSAIWLIRADVFSACIDALFLRGPTAKGSPAAIFLRPVMTTVTQVGLHAPALVAVGVLAIVLLLRNRRVQAFTAGAMPFLGPLALSALAIAATSGLLGPTSRVLSLGACYASLIGMLLLSVRAVYRLVTSPNERTAHIGLAAVSGLAISYSLSISWPAFEVMLFPSLAVLIGLAFDRPWAGEATSVMRRVTAACAIALATIVAIHKTYHPASFLDWEEPPILVAHSKPDVPQLEGFTMSPETAAFYDGMTALIQQSSVPNDRLFAFPLLGEFYALSDRPPATYAVANMPDVIPDWVAREDAQRLLRDPPAVMLLERLSADYYQTQDTIFRGGRPGGYHSILDAIAALIPKYERIAMMHTPGTATPIELWVRRR